MNPLDAYEDILASLHQAALDDACWPAASALIDDACGIRGNALVVGKGSSPANGDILFASFCYEGVRHPDRERWYFDHFFPIDERVPRIARAPDSRLIPITELYTREELKSSPAYNEALPRGGYQNGLNVRLDARDGSSIVWTLAGPATSGAWESARLRLVERLLPHIRQFVLVRQALAAADALGASLSALLDNSRIGVLHLDRRGRLLAANAPALDILRRGRGLSDEGGTLHAWLPADSERLQKLLGRALPGPWGEPGSGGSMTIRRPSDPTPLGLHISPVGDARADYGGCRVAALVLVVDPAFPPHIDPVRVAEMFGLTPSEGRVAALLAEGRSVSEIVAATGYRPGYVRQLLKRVYKKEDVSGQVALVPRILAMDALPRR